MADMENPDTLIFEWSLVDGPGYKCRTVYEFTREQAEKAVECKATWTSAFRESLREAIDKKWPPKPKYELWKEAIVDPEWTKEWGCLLDNAPELVDAARNLMLEGFWSCPEGSRLRQALKACGVPLDD